MLTSRKSKKSKPNTPATSRREAVSVEALKIVQRHRGWVSDDAMADVARLLEMDVAELDAVATFYNLIYRKPTGRHVILVCNSVSCWVMGGETIRQHLKRVWASGWGKPPRTTGLPSCRWSAWGPASGAGHDDRRRNLS